MVFRKISRPRIEGCVDSWSPNVTGWVINIDQPSDPVEVALVVDRNIVARVLADDPRPDVLESGHESGWCGFSIPAHECVTDAIPHDVSLVHTTSGEELFRSSVRVSFNSERPILPPEHRGTASVINVHGDLAGVQGIAKAGGSIAIISAFRPIGISNRATSDYAGALRRAGFTVVVVDTSTDPLETDTDADLVVHRINEGWDFASWDTARELLSDDLKGAREILLTNDSCFGPFAELGSLFDRIRSKNLDVTSLTDGWFSGYHLQSNFLYFRGEVIKSDPLGRFFAGYGFPKLKSSIVREGEIGLSRFLLADGFEIGALHDYQSLSTTFLADFERRMAALRLDERSLDVGIVRWMVDIRESLIRGTPLNTTHVFWEELLRAGMPFVKRDLLAKNPLGCPTLGRLEPLLAESFAYEDCEWILDDLKCRGASVPPFRGNTST